MDFVNGKDLALCGGLDPSCTVLILHDGVFQQMQMQDILNYLAGARVTTDTTLRQEGMAADSAAVREYVDGKRAAYTGVLSTSWTGSGPYTQTVAVSGILATDMPHIMPAYSSDNATAIAQKEAWSCVSKAEAAAGGIKFTCFEDKPTTAVPLQIEVMR